MNKEICTLSDLFIEIGGLIKNYEDNVKINTAKEAIPQLYGINDITKIQPKLTKYILTKAIDEGLLPFTWVGNERCLYLEDVEKYLESNTSRKQITTWRDDRQCLS